MRDDTARWTRLDKTHCWHPFTRQSEWCAADHDPVVITHGKGVHLFDSEGNRYIDGNSSIWTNIHGHAHPHLNAAICAQLEKISHSSFLGFTHPLAGQLAEKLISFFPENTLTRCFFSDDGSTAIECALKMSLQSHRQNGQGRRTQFVTFDKAYHGDTLGASSIGGVGRFQTRTNGFPALRLTSVAELSDIDPQTTAAIVIEPLIQGVNEMRIWPEGMLRELRRWCDGNGVHLILDEVMTGFGRTGKMFACQHEDVVPDFLCLAKGLTGGYLPLAATLTTETIYSTFLGAAGNAFYYGHSYTANPLGCAAAIASLELFEWENTLGHLPAKIDLLADLLKTLSDAHPVVHETRRRGFVAGIELRQPSGEKFPLGDRTGEKLCRIAARHGLLTRAILDTIVVMLPLSATAGEIHDTFRALDSALSELCGKSGH